MNKQWSITAEKFLSLEQVKVLLKYLERERDLAIAREVNKQAIRDYYSIRALLETGVRVFEFCNLNNSDFQGQKLIVQRGKGGKARTVLLTRSTANLLKEWHSIMPTLGFNNFPDAPMFPSRYYSKFTTRAIQKRVKAVLKACGLPEHLSAHSLRHTYCSLLLSTGKVPLTTVRDNLGHHSLTITNLYAHAVADIGTVDLYSSSSSEKDEICEPAQPMKRKKANSIVESFLRNANQKQPEVNSRLPTSSVNQTGRRVKVR